MKLGVFDSGLGGLIIARAIRDNLPNIDMLYYGDTLRVPYGSRSTETITDFTRQAIGQMFDAGCQLIVVACNTASAAALRTLQQNWVHDAYPGRNIIGVVVPTLEEASDRNLKHLALIGTNYIVSSNIYAQELKKINPQIDITQIATPLLVPLIENGGMQWASDVLQDYLKPLFDNPPDALLLGCTHYARLKPLLENLMGDAVQIMSQDDIIPHKLSDYLDRHPEYADKIGKNGNTEFFVSDVTDHYIKSARDIWGKPINVQLMSQGRSL